MSVRTIQPGRRAVEKLRAGVYGRESKDKTKSIDDQIDEGVEAVEDNGWALVGKYSDGESASRFGKKARKDWAALLADLDAGRLDVVVIWEASRGDRDLERWVPFVARCRDHGVLIYIVEGGETVDPRTVSGFRRLIQDGLDAHLESEKTSKRTLRGVEASAKTGAFHGGPTPYGYTREFDHIEKTRHGDKVIRRQVRNEDTAPIVERIFKAVAGEIPITKIVADFNNEGITAPGGGRWNRDIIRRIIRRRAYLGQRFHNGVVYVRTREEAGETIEDPAWPPLVDADLFRDANAVLDKPDRKTAKPGRQKYLLSYLITTPCDALVNLRPERPGHYRAQYVCHVNSCASIGADEADELIARVVSVRLVQPDARAALLPLQDNSARVAEQEVAALEMRLADADASYSAGRISIERLERIEADLKPKIVAARAKVIPAHVPTLLRDMVEATEEAEARRLWDNAVVPARRALIVYVFDSIKIAKTTPETRVHRRSSQEDRLRAARHRLTLDWRSAAAS